MSKFLKREIIDSLDKLPKGAYFFKEKNGKRIFKNRFKDEFYIVMPFWDKYIVDFHIGRCKC